MLLYLSRIYNKKLNLVGLSAKITENNHKKLINFLTIQKKRYQFFRGLCKAKKVGYKCS